MLQEPRVGSLRSLMAVSRLVGVWSLTMVRGSQVGSVEDDPRLLGPVTNTLIWARIWTKAKPFLLNLENCGYGFQNDEG